MSDEYKIEPTSRKVIEGKLLTALEETGVCAALLSEQDVEDLIVALRTAERSCESLEQEARMSSLADGLVALHRSVFNR